VDTGDLLQALLEGLGLAELPRPPGGRDAAEQQLTPEVMQRLGELLAGACEGTVELLQARATLKQALRADLTVIGARNNNPLKFVPDGQTALVQLLAAQPVRGFMAPRQAMRDAYDDLLAHQIGFLAGMRAAMHGLIGRFDPKALEQRLASKSVLDAMVPGARKGRLWELFNSLYSEVAREAEDDFDRLFGRAFVKAYEEQVARIEAGSAPREGSEPGGR
jgi:FHA domain-containing protein